MLDVGYNIWRSKGPELESANKEFINTLKKLEGAMGDKDYFGGDKFGFVDIIMVSLSSWYPAYEKFGGFKIETEASKIAAWIKRCYHKEYVAKGLPDSQQVVEFVGTLRKMNELD